MADGGTQLIKADDGSGDVILREPGPDIQKTQTDGHFDNLTSIIEQTKLDKLASDLMELINVELADRESWLEAMAERTKLLGMDPESKPDDGQYANADRSEHTLLLTALTRFQSKALAALIPTDELLCTYKSAVDLDAFEDEDERDEMQAKVDAAGKRVCEFVTDYLKERDLPYEEDADLVLYNCGFGGLGIKKIHTDHSRSRNKVRVSAVEDGKLLISYATKTFNSGRITEVIDMSTPDFIRNIVTGAYSVDRIPTQEGSTEVDPLTAARDYIDGIVSEDGAGGGTHRLYEVYTSLFLPEDPHSSGLARPYIITIHEASGQVFSIRRNWMERDPDELAIKVYVGYIYSPGKRAVTGIGLAQLLGNQTKALRTAQRSALDAAYLQNHPFGYKLNAAKIRDQSTPIQPGEFVDVDAPTDDIRRAMIVWQFAGPSPGLLQLSDTMTQSAKELGGVASIDFANLMKSGVAAGPAMAAFEESTEFQTAVHRRIYRANAEEFTILQKRLQEVYGNRPALYGEGKTLEPGDLQLVKIKPAMPPGQVSRQKTIMQATALVEAAERMPEVIDARQAGEDLVRALGVSDPDRILLPDPADEEPPQPADPVTEYGMVMADEAIAVGMNQNHQAHITAHAAQMRGLQTSELPIDAGEAASAILAAHIAEHMAMDMRVKAAAAVGVSPDELGPEMDPEMEAQISGQLAEAVVQIEAERAPEEAQPDDKVALEQVKGKNAQELQKLKGAQNAELEKMKARHAAELKDADLASKEKIAEEDDETALKIAQMKAEKPSGDAKAPAGAGAGATSTAKAVS